MAVGGLNPFHHAGPVSTSGAPSVSAPARLRDAADRTLGQAATPQGVAAQPPKRELPPGSYDVSQITQEQLDGLKASRDPKDHRLAATIQRSRVAYADIIKNGGQIIANRSEGNGGSPVVTLLPPGFDPNKETRVHTHYHGFNSTVAEGPGHSAGLVSRIEEVQKRDAAAGTQTVFVLPEAGNAPDKGGDYHTDWTNVKSQVQTTESALQAAGVTHPGFTVVSAHSGGGAALAHAIAQHPDGSGIKADRLELQDCFYGSQDSIKAWGDTASGHATKQVVYYHGTNDSKNDAGFQKTFGDRYHRLEVPNPKPGDVPRVTNAAGHLVPAYSADPHNRTVGQYTDAYPDH